MAAFVLAADVISKAIVVARMADHPPIRLLGGLLTITLTRNGGAAFSIGTSMTIVFTAIAVGVIVYILRTARNLRSIGWAITLGLLLGGATGNLLDRIFRAPGPFQGHVVDWIELPHWPVFNLADSSIVCAGVLVVLLALRGIRLDGTRPIPDELPQPATSDLDPYPDHPDRYPEPADPHPEPQPQPDNPKSEYPEPQITVPARRIPLIARRRWPMTAQGERRLAVPEGLDGERLDAALARMFGLSRSKAAELIGDGLVLLDGLPAAKSDRVLAGEPLQVTLPPPRPAEPPRPVEGLIVLYEDDDIIVVDKPRGVAAHPTPGWTGPTVIGGLLAAGHTVATSGAAERQGIVHRLDANTTGVMVVAKSERAYSALKRAFRERTVDKRYHALVQGHPDPLRGTVDAPIGRHPSGDGRFAVVSDGRPSVTHYDTLEAFRAASLVSVDLETGRTHQIRVHMAAIRHPCVGDLLYGADPVLAARLGLTRQWLHAVSLTFAHPADGREVSFTSAYPPDLAHALDILRAES